MCKTDSSTRTLRRCLPTTALWLTVCLSLLAGVAVGAPAITSITPTTGGPGVNVVLIGTGLSTVTAVQFNGTVASTFTTVSDTEIDTTPPTGATTGLITATGPDGTGTSPVPFTVGAIPANDNFVNAQSLAGTTPVSVSGTNAGATRETGEPVIVAGVAGGRSIWYSFTPDSSGDYTVTTRGSDFHTLLGIFTGDTVSTLTAVAAEDSGPEDLTTSALTFTALRGVTYFIAVDGVNGAAGDVRLSILTTDLSIDLYMTGFESSEGFVISTPLVGQNGWASVDNITGGNGITANVIPNLNQQGYVGGGTLLRGGASSVQVFHPVSYTVSSEDLDGIVNFSTVLEITASTNGEADRFGFTASGAANNSAAAEATGRYFTIFFDEATHTVSYQLNDGSAPVQTGVPYSDGVVYVLQEDLDFTYGFWTATLNGVPLVPDVAILADATGVANSLTRISADWTPANAANPGNNLLAFDGYSVSVPDFVPPTLLVQPVSQTVAAGQPTVFLVEPIGLGTFTYQWYFNGAAIAGATSPNYTIPITNPTDAGRYHVIVSSELGAVQSPDAFLVVSTTLAVSGSVVQNNPQVPQVTASSGQIGSVLLTRTGDLSGALTVDYRVGGSAESGVDFQALPGTVNFKAGRSKKRIKVVTIDRGIRDGSSVVVAIKVLDGNGYTPGTTVKQKVTIVRD